MKRILMLLVMLFCSGCFRHEHYRLKIPPPAIAPQPPAPTIRSTPPPPGAELASGIVMTQARIIAIITRQEIEAVPKSFELPPVAKFTVGKLIVRLNGHLDCKDDKYISSQFKSGLAELSDKELSASAPVVDFQIEAFCYYSGEHFDMLVLHAFNLKTRKGVQESIRDVPFDEALKTLLKRMLPALIRQNSSIQIRGRPYDPGIFIAQTKISPTLVREIF